MDLTPINCMRIFVATSIFFVWVVRYENIITEFKEYALPGWLRDSVGITKMACALGLLIGGPHLNKASALTIAFLMICAQATHFKAGTKAFKRLPSAVLLVLTLFIGFNGTL